MSAIASKLLLFWLACPVLVVVFAWDFVRWRRLLRHGRRVRGTTKTPRVVVERRQYADRRRHYIRYDYRVGETYYEGEVGSFEYSADKAAAGREVVVLYMPGRPGKSRLLDDGPGCFNAIALLVAIAGTSLPLVVWMVGWESLRCLFVSRC